MLVGDVGTNKETYSVYFGLDYGSDEGRVVRWGDIYLVSNISDVNKVPFDFPLESFNATFSRIFRNTRVSVKKLVSLVYIFRSPMPNFSEVAVGGGRTYRTLY